MLGHVVVCWMCSVGLGWSWDVQSSGMLSCSVGCGSGLSCCVNLWCFAKCIMLACSGCVEHGFGMFTKMVN